MVILDAAIRGYGLGWHSFRANGWNIFDAVVGLGSLTTTLVVRFWSKGGIFTTLQKLFIVAIAFKLVQRADSLNKLFKTAMYAQFLIWVALDKRWFQFKSSRYPQLDGSVVDSVHVLRHHVCRGF